MKKPWTLHVMLKPAKVASQGDYAFFDVQDADGNRMLTWSITGTPESVELEKEKANLIVNAVNCYPA